MAKMNKAYAWAEMKDGREFEDVRVTLETRIQAGKTAKARGWDTERGDSAVFLAFCAWHALKAAGKLDETWDEFTAAVVDANLYTDDEDDDLDPTSPDHSAG